jgi:hypothetical protein
MRCGRTLGPYSLALLLGLAAPCVHAQRHGGGPHASAAHVNAAKPRQNYQPAPSSMHHGAGRAQGRAPQSRGAVGGGAPGGEGNANEFRPPANTETNAQHPAGNSPQSGATNTKQHSMSNLPPKWAENLRDRSPEEQERFMQNNERFKNLPPAQQAQIRQKLKEWNNLSPTERNAMRDRQETWQRMSPEQRTYVQRSLLPKWQAMSADRKALVTGRLHTLQQMNPDQRAAALNDPRFMQGLSPDEQSVLRGLDSIRSPNP